MDNSNKEIQKKEKAEEPQEHPHAKQEVPADKGPSKKAQKKLEKQNKKEETKAATKKAQEAHIHEYVKDPNDPCAHKFGDKELNRSQGDPEKRYEKKYTRIQDIDDHLIGQQILVRGRLHNSRATGKMAFVVMRESFATVQALLFVGEEASVGMIQYARHIPRESIVDVIGIVSKPENPIESCSQKVEILIKEIYTVNKSVPRLPFVMEDAMRRVENQAEEDEDRNIEKKEEKKEEKKKESKEDKTEEKKGEGKEEGHEEKKTGKKDKQNVRVYQDTRLDHRIIDLRVPTNQALMRIQSGVGLLFREFLIQKDFIEIHSPKLTPGSSEGGANVFKLQYFGREACLAQSPQLYKQMAVCADLERVFEIGPVFRAENSNTNRHLCEFTGLDLEMAFKEHYFEVLDVLGDMFVYIFEGLNARYAKELETINAQYPFEPFKFAKPALKLEFKEAIRMLKEEKGIVQDPLQDLTTHNEAALGAFVKEKYNTDFYMLYHYPTNARPFYTMLDPHDPNYTNSYDFFMRGEEIISGAQRIHDPEMLTERAKAHGIKIDTIKDYIDSFRYGAPPHGGCGVGLERVVKLFCGIHNIRKCCLFPRDPKRLTP